MVCAPRAEEAVVDGLYSSGIRRFLPAILLTYRYLHTTGFRRACLTVYTFIIYRLQAVLNKIWFTGK